MISYNTGATNYKNAGVPDLYVDYEDSFGNLGQGAFCPQQGFLPFRLAFNDTWDSDPYAGATPGYYEPETAVLYESVDLSDCISSARVADGSYYYGFLAGPVPGTPTHQNPLLVTDTYTRYDGAMPNYMQPNVVEAPPWEGNGFDTAF